MSKLRLLSLLPIAVGVIVGTALLVERWLSVGPTGGEILRGLRRAASGDSGPSQSAGQATSSHVSPQRDPAPEAAHPGTAQLSVDSDLPGAQVSFDGQSIGTVPLVIYNVIPGRHQLDVSAEGYDRHTENFDVQSGRRDIFVSFKRVELDSSIDVVHKHFFGSCRGRLSATATGFRYETQESKDGFAAPFDSIESFKIDYSKKNLVIKVRKGRTYNFRDPDGSADRLYLFLQDVELARSQMERGE